VQHHTAVRKSPESAIFVTEARPVLSILQARLILPAELDATVLEHKHELPQMDTTTKQRILFGYDV
jgi:hypothetical protein